MDVASKRKRRGWTDRWSKPTVPPSFLRKKTRGSLKNANTVYLNIEITRRTRFRINIALQLKFGSFVFSETYSAFSPSLSLPPSLWENLRFCREGNLKSLRMSFKDTRISGTNEISFEPDEVSFVRVGVCVGECFKRVLTGTEQNLRIESCEIRRAPDTGETFSLCSRRDTFLEVGRYFIYENCQRHDPLWYFENCHAQVHQKIHAMVCSPGQNQSGACQATRLLCTSDQCQTCITDLECTCRPSVFRHEHIRFPELADGKSNQFSSTTHVDDALFIKSIFVIINWIICAEYRAAIDSSRSINLICTRTNAED